MKDASFAKAQRMKRIASYVAPKLKDGAKIPLDKMVAWIEINVGLTPRKAKQYLSTLATAYDWDVKDGFLSKEMLEASDRK